MADLPGTNDWHGPAVNRGVPKVEPEDFSGEDRRHLKDAERAALATANNMRALLELPEVRRIEPGKPKDPYSCPLANTIRKGTDLTVRVDTEEIRASRPGVGPLRHITPTEAVQNFQVWVDHGFYPELVE